MTKLSRVIKFSLFLLAVSLIFIQRSYAVTTISYGQILSGTISAAGQQDEYIFIAAANDVICIFVAATSGNLIPRLGSSQSNYIFDAKLSESGDYIFTVSDNDNTHTGIYQVSLQ